MGYFSNRVERRHLKPGDHIYSWRRAFIYSHHGDDKVVHLAASLFSCSSWVSRAGETCSACDLLDYRERTSGVILSCVDCCFLGGGSLYLYEYGVSEWAYMFRFRGGTCNTAESAPVQVVMERAWHMLENGFGEYNLFNNNCEDFATYLKQPEWDDGRSTLWSSRAFLLTHLLSP